VQPASVTLVRVIGFIEFSPDIEPVDAMLGMAGGVKVKGTAPKSGVGATSTPSSSSSSSDTADASGRQFRYVPCHRQVAHITASVHSLVCL
jgi:hypothetical protein